MVVNINELRGTLFKKVLGINRCRFGYHNKNNNGGNFGLDFYTSENFNPNTDFSLNGSYDKSGNIRSLDVMSIRIGSFRYMNLVVGDIDSLIKQLKNIYTDLAIEDEIEKKGIGKGYSSMETKTDYEDLSQEQIENYASDEIDRAYDTYMDDRAEREYEEMKGIEGGFRD